MPRNLDDFQDEIAARHAALAEGGLPPDSLTLTPGMLTAAPATERNNHDLLGIYRVLRPIFYYDATSFDNAYLIKHGYLEPIGYHACWYVDDGTRIILVQTLLPDREIIELEEV